jgi:hypothetical protein
MADPELVRILDYILNRCDEKSIEAVAAAVIRRRRDLALFGNVRNMPDPKKLARELSSSVNIGAGIKDIKDSVRSMAARIIQQEAPELTDEQITELLGAWIPEEKTGEEIPRGLIAAMVEQFISFSLGRMNKKEDRELRAEMGAWPDRYWKIFPPVIRLIITDFLKGEMTEGEFSSKIGTALAMEPSQ